MLCEFSCPGCGTTRSVRQTASYGESVLCSCGRQMELMGKVAEKPVDPSIDAAFKVTGQSAEELREGTK